MVSELVTTPLGGDHTPWNRTTRKDYKRDGRRYESDVTDKNIAVFGPDYLRQTHVRENEIGTGQARRCTILYEPSLVAAVVLMTS